MMYYIVVILVLFLYSLKSKPGMVTNVVKTNDIDLSWDPVDGATSYEVRFYSESFAQWTPEFTRIVTKEPSVSFTYSSQNAFNIIYEITASSFWGPGPKYIGTSYACFPAGTKVTLSDFSKVNIEDIKVGQQVLGAFGEINCVLGIQNLIVGQNQLVKINDRHITTDHHPHVSFDKQFLVPGSIGDISNKVYGQKHTIFDGTQNVLRELDGLDPKRLAPMTIGSELKTVYGSEFVNAIEPVSLDPYDKLYNLVIDGSHTYSVNGFFVTGWPSEKDFNYDTWSSK